VNIHNSDGVIILAASKLLKAPGLFGMEVAKARAILHGLDLAMQALEIHKQGQNNHFTPSF
jgi:hypothetical protein